MLDGMQLQPVQSVRREKLPQLDVLRGICAVMVALHHAEFRSPLRELNVVLNGALFVDFFFVLSGFIIAYNYENLASLPQLGRFMGLRFARVYPLHVVMLFVFLLYECLQWLIVRMLHIPLSTAPFGDNDAVAFVLNLTLLNGVGLRELSFNVPSWSISAEFWTYLLFGLTVTSVSSLTSSKEGRGKLHAWLFGGLALASLAVLTLVNPTPNLQHAEHFALPRCIFSFFLGALLCSLMPARPPAVEGAQPAVRSRLGGALQLAAMALALIAVSLPTPGHNGGPIELAAPFAFLLVIGVFARFPNTGVVSALTNGPCIWLGTVSYSIYMVHMIVLLPFEAFLRIVLHAPKTEQYGIEIDPLLGTGLSVVYVACVLVLASFTYRFIEAPGREWGRELLRSRRDRPRVQSAAPEYIKE